MKPFGEAVSLKVDQRDTGGLGQGAGLSLHAVCVTLSWRDGESCLMGGVTFLVHLMSGDGLMRDVDLSGPL